MFIADLFWTNIRVDLQFKVQTQKPILDILSTRKMILFLS